MESTFDKECPVFSLIESISGNNGIYSQTCDMQCAFFSQTFNTCIFFAEKATNIQKILSRYKG